MIIGGRVSYGVEYNQLVFNMDDLFRYAARVLFEISLTATGWSRKPVPPPLPWSSHDVSVLIPRPPTWPD